MFGNGDIFSEALEAPGIDCALPKLEAAELVGRSLLSGLGGMRDAVIRRNPRCGSALVCPAWACTRYLRGDNRKE